MAVSDTAPQNRQKVVLIGGDGGFSGVPRHLRHIVRACGSVANLVVLSDRDRGGYGFVSESGARHIQLPGLRTRVSPLACWRALRHLRRVVFREDPALVWAHSRMAVLLLRCLILTCGFAGVRRPAVAITFHGLPFGRGRPRVVSVLALNFERLALRYGPVQQLIFLSHAAREQYRNAVGEPLCSRHPCHVLPNCSDLDDTALACGLRNSTPITRLGRPVRHIVMTGRAARQKNLRRALRILAELPGNYRLSICGAGTNDKAFRDEARRILGPCGLARVTLMGEVADVRPILAEADCYLLTSRYEGMPVGALEAFEAGLPLALSAISGTQELRTTHPLCTELCAEGGGGRGDRFADQEDALRIIALTEHFCATRESAQAQIHAVWRQQYSFAARAPEMRRLLLQDLLPAAKTADRPRLAEPPAVRPEPLVMLTLTKNTTRRRPNEAGSGPPS